MSKMKEDRVKSVLDRMPVTKEVLVALGIDPAKALVLFRYYGFRGMKEFLENFRGWDWVGIERPNKIVVSSDSITDTGDAKGAAVRICFNGYQLLVHGEFIDEGYPFKINDIIGYYPNGKTTFQDGKLTSVSTSEKSILLAYRKDGELGSVEVQKKDRSLNFYKSIVITRASLWPEFFETFNFSRATGHGENEYSIQSACQVWDLIYEDYTFVPNLKAPDVQFNYFVDFDIARLPLVRACRSDKERFLFTYEGETMTATNRNGTGVQTIFDGNCEDRPSIFYHVFK